jgi:hypothetical protein
MRAPQLDTTGALRVEALESCRGIEFGRARLEAAMRPIKERGRLVELECPDSV